MRHREMATTVDLRTGARRIYYQWAEYDRLRRQLGVSNAHAAKLLGYHQHSWHYWKTHKYGVEEATFIGLKALLLTGVLYRDVLIGDIARYNFSSLRAGARKYVRALTPYDKRRVAKAASKYGKEHGFRTKSKWTPKGVWIYRLHGKLQ